MKSINDTIIVQKPTKALLDMIAKMREHKAFIREEMRSVEPVFVIQA